MTDETDAARDTVVDDMHLTGAVPVVGYLYFFGSIDLMVGLEIDISTAGVGDWVIVWEYKLNVVDPWLPLDNLQDGTNGFRVLGKSTVTFTPPVGWVRVLTGFGRNVYLIRARVDTVTTITQEALGDRKSVV